jgi:hypothetical protein
MTNQTSDRPDRMEFGIEYRHREGDAILARISRLMLEDRTLTLSVRASGHPSAETVCAITEGHRFSGVAHGTEVCGSFHVDELNQIVCDDLTRKHPLPNQNDTGSFTGTSEPPHGGPSTDAVEP